MNEFIVWDEVNARFLHDTEERKFLIGSNGKVFKKTYGLESLGSNIILDYMNELKAFNYIGKTDIEGNKIYADCSIVEFEYYDMDVDSGWVKGISYITFDDEYLMYLIAIDGALSNFKENEIIGLKVIGTLQENPELLNQTGEA